MLGLHGDSKESHSFWLVLYLCNIHSQLPLRLQLLHFSNYTEDLTSIQIYIKVFNQGFPRLEVSTRHEMEYTHCWNLDGAALGIIFDNVCDSACLIDFVADCV